MSLSIVCFMFDCVGKVIVFSLKVSVLFLGWVVFLLANPCIVFQRVCVLCL